jgi:adenine deaminase
LMVDLPEYDYPSWFKESVSLHPSFNRGKLRRTIQKGRHHAHVRVIEVSNNAVFTRCSIEELPVVGGEIQPDPERDILKLCTIERYGKNGNVLVAFVRGFGLKRGAIGSSVSHDHHNLMIVGCSDNAILRAAEELKQMNGGWISLDEEGDVVRMPLTCGGLMSDGPFERVASERAAVSKNAKEQLGSCLNDPLAVLSFFGLSTVPEYGVSDKGLIEVSSRELVDVVCS